MSDDEAEAAVPEVRAGQRIAKVMARAGVCSRRDAEAWIAEGRVSVNGKALSSPAFNVSEADDVRVDGKPLAGPERTRLFFFHKPKGLVTTARDPEGRPTVFAALPPGLPRLIAVGRLDLNTEGLLLLTNDGGLARVLELPSTGWLRRYRVRAHGSIDQTALDRLAGGVTIDGVDYQGVEANFDREQGANAWLTLGLREGKNREIKVILEHLGLAVNRLIRVSFGPFELGDLPAGDVMEAPTRVLREQLGPRLAREAGADFDAPLIVRDRQPLEPSQAERPQSERGQRENRAMQGRSGRGANGGARGTERDRAPRRGPQPSTPERRRKHVSALRAEIAADASGAKGPRTRVERGATQDRKGRTVAVERISRPRGEAIGRGAPETQTKRTGRPKAGERGGRAFEPGARRGKRDSFGPKRAGGAGGRERAPRLDNTEPRRRQEGPDAGRRAGGPRARRFDHPSAKGGGSRDRAARTEAAGPARERRFDRPKETRDRTDRIRPPRSDAKNRGARPEFKSRQSRPGERDGDRPRPRVRDEGGEAGPARGRSGGRPRPPGKGSPSGRGPRRPPRKR